MKIPSFFPRILESACTFQDLTKHVNTYYFVHTLLRQVGRIIGSHRAEYFLSMSIPMEPLKALTVINFASCLHKGYRIFCGGKSLDSAQKIDPYYLIWGVLKLFKESGFELFVLFKNTLRIPYCNSISDSFIGFSFLLKALYNWDKNRTCVKNRAQWLELAINKVHILGVFTEYSKELQRIRENMKDNKILSEISEDIKDLKSTLSGENLNNEIEYLEFLKKILQLKDDNSAKRGKLKDSYGNSSSKEAPQILIKMLSIDLTNCISSEKRAEKLKEYLDKESEIVYKTLFKSLKFINEKDNSDKLPLLSERIGVLKRVKDFPTEGKNIKLTSLDMFEKLIKKLSNYPNQYLFSSVEEEHMKVIKNYLREVSSIKFESHNFDKEIEIKNQLSLLTTTSYFEEITTRLITCKKLVDEFKKLIGGIDNEKRANLYKQVSSEILSIKETMRQLYLQKGLNDNNTLIDKVKRMLNQLFMLTTDESEKAFVGGVLEKIENRTIDTYLLNSWTKESGEIFAKSLDNLTVELKKKIQLETKMLIQQLSKEESDKSIKELKESIDDYFTFVQNIQTDFFESKEKGKDKSFEDASEAISKIDKILNELREKNLIAEGELLKLLEEEKRKLDQCPQWLQKWETFGLPIVKGGFGLALLGIRWFKYTGKIIPNDKLDSILDSVFLGYCVLTNTYRIFQKH